MKNKFNYVLKTLFLFVSFLFLGCEVQEEVVANSKVPKDFTIKTISIERLNAKLSKTKNKPDFSKIMTSRNDKLQQAKISNDAGVEIYTENIKEVTQGDYTSYTMLITIPQTNGDAFYNIIIEVKNDTSSFFITGYLPTENWKENPTQNYEGQITTFRIPGGGNSVSGNELQDYIEDVIQDSDLLSGSYGFGNTTGGGQPSSYPWDCNGEVVTTYVIQPVMCSEDIHWPWSPGTCSASTKAYYETITTYECIPSPFDNGDNNPPTGGTTPGGGGGSTGSSPTSLTVVIKPDAPICQPAIPGDLNGDCLIDEDEANFIDYVAALSTDQKHFLDVNSSIKNDVFYFLVDNNWSVESKDYVEDCIDASINFILEYGDTVENQNLIDDFIDSVLNNDDNSDSNDDGTTLPPDCASFNFTSPSSTINWQQSAVVNIHFTVLVGTPSGVFVNHVIEYPTPILFGMPKNLAVGNTNISPGLAATLSAAALNKAIKETVNKYGNKNVSYLIVEQYFESRLKHNFEIGIPGARLNLHPQSYPTPTQYQTNASGLGDCQ